jgi:hypothetical protein
MAFILRNTALVLLAVLLWPTSAPLAGDKTAAPRLSLPIRCVPGRDCWLVNTVDLDPEPGIRDYACAKRSYNGHKGIDIAIRDLVAMKNGVDVLAAAGGVVKGVRNSMADVDFTVAGAASVKGRECGNGLVVSHRGGWETQYCHMRRGSVVVKPGATIVQGQKLGLVGHSGKAQYPHVHLSVRHNKQVVSPFAGLGRKRACGLGPAPLWTKKALAALNIEGTALFNAGFASAALKPEKARSGLMTGQRMSRRAAALVLWVDMYWPKAGDEILFRITAPDGRLLLEKDMTVKKTQARRFVFVGKKRKTSLWPPGVYRGEIVLKRKGARLLSTGRQVDLR